MIRKSFEYLLWSIPTSILLIVIGFLIANHIIGDPKTLDVTLFILGATPIVIFLPSVFSSSTSGALHTPKVIFRKVDTLERKEANSEDTGVKISFSSPLSLVLAGLITWLVGLLLFIY